MVSQGKATGSKVKRDRESEDEGFFVHLWYELKRRKTIRVLSVYAATSFLILQVADLIVEPLKLPSWTLTFLIILMGTGFIFAVVLSWIYDITPEGIKKTASEKSATRLGIPFPEKKRTGKWVIISISGIFIVLLLLANDFYLSKGSVNSNDFSKLEKSVAVIPFRNDSPDETNDYFINGIMEEVLNHLQMIKDLRVISRTSVEQYRNTTKSIPEIAREQGVNFIVEGSGQKYGNSFAVKVQLIRAVKEAHLWGKSFKQEIQSPADIINVQSQIAKAVASELQATMTPLEQKQIEKVPTSNLNAYDFYQRGREELTNYVIDYDNRKALENAEKLFRKSLEFDPEFADAIAGQALVYLNKNYWDDYQSNNLMDTVLILSNIALSFDEKLSDAYFAKGEYFEYKGQKEKAITEFNKALEFNPNYWRAYLGKAFVYESTDLIESLRNLMKAASINNDSFSATLNRLIGGKLLVSGYIDESRKYFNKGFEIDRDSAFLLSCLGGTESDLGNYTKAIGYFKRANDNRANYSEVILRLGKCYLFTGKPEEALKYLKEYSKLVPNDINPYIASAYWLNGYREKAEELFKARLEFCSRILENNQQSPNIFWVYYDLACIQSFRGDTENALKNLSLFSKGNYCELWMVTNVRNDPMLTNIRNDPSFKRILSDMENKYQALHSNVGQWLQN